MDNSYLAGFIDGDGSICIGKCKGGFQLKLEITQCNRMMLTMLNKQFTDIGKLYCDNRDEKYTKESAIQLRFCGKNASKLLDIARTYAIVKAPQALLAIEYLTNINKPGMYDIREDFYNRMKSMNKDKNSYEKDYSKINDAYIAGLLDAEGNIYYNKTDKVRYYVKITQKCDPTLINHIRTYLGYGQISASELYRIRFSSRQTVKDLWDRIKGHIIIKQEAYAELLNKLDIPL
jgi:hypothetical protein